MRTFSPGFFMIGIYSAVNHECMRNRFLLAVITVNFRISGIRIIITGYQCLFYNIVSK